MSQANKIIRFSLSAVDIIYLALASGWLLALLSFLGQILLSHRFAATINTNPYFFLDYVKYYVFTAVSLSDQSRLIYDPHVQWAWTERLLAPAHLHQLMFSEYPPFTGLLLAPLRAFPLDWGFAFWLAFLLTAAFVPTAIISRSLHKCSAVTIAAILVAIFATVPGEWATLLGQLNWVMVGMIGLLFLSLQRGNNWLSAAALAVMSLKPQYAVFFVAPVIGARRWKVLLIFATIEIVLLSLCAWRVGAENVLGYPSILFQAVGKGQVAGITLPSFASDPLFSVSARRLLDLMLPATLSASLSTVLFVAGMVAAGFCCWKVMRSAGSSSNLPWAMAISTLLFLVVNPHCHVHDCVSLAFVAAATLPHVGLARVWEFASAKMRIWALLVYAYGPLSWLVFIGLSPESILRTLYFLGMNAALLLVACLILKEVVPAKKRDGSAPQP